MTSLKTMMRKRKKKNSTCSNFSSITHQHYEDAGCYGCSFLMMWTDGYVDCMHPKEHFLKRETIECKAFGLADIVVRCVDND